MKEETHGRDKGERRGGGGGVVKMAGVGCCIDRQLIGLTLAVLCLFLFH